MENKRQTKPTTPRSKRVLRWGLIGIWLLLVAGWPLYYLQEDRDWYYPRWGTPKEIVTSYQVSANPLYEDEGVYSRIFIVHPSEENLAYFDSLTYKHCAFSESIAPLLKQHNLPGPYRYASTGCVNFVIGGNGLMLVHDFSRNKGGLTSDRLAAPEKVVRSYPQSFVIYYLWAWVSIALLALSPILLALSPILLVPVRLISALWRSLHKKK